MKMTLNGKKPDLEDRTRPELTRERENGYYGDITKDNSPFTLNKHVGTCHCTITH